MLYRKVDTLRVAAALASWMFQIVRHECVRKARQKILRQTPAAPTEISTEEAALIRMDMERIVECIATLPREQRVVFVLRDVHGLSGAETARELGIGRDAMKSRLHRARKALRTQLRTDGHGLQQDSNGGDRGR